MGNRCFLCGGSHVADGCTTYRSLEEREKAVETLKLCWQCLQPAVTDHLHLRPACKHCGKAHHHALCPLEPWRRGTTCAFCLGYHNSDACGKFKRINKRLRAVDTLKICRRCLSRTHMEDDCTSTQRCKRCGERHHQALCELSRKRNKRRRHRIRRVSPLRDGPSNFPPESREENVNNVPNNTDKTEVIGVVQSSKSNTKKSSKERTKKPSSSSEYQREVDKLKAQVAEGRRELRLAKEAKRRAERERDTARKERDDAQDSCKALQKRIHDLKEENRNCEAIRQVTAAAVEASIEIVMNREETRRRTIEQERDDAMNNLLEAEKRIEALKKAAGDAVRLTLEFQAWRIRAVLKAKKVGASHKESSNNCEDGSTLSENVESTLETAKTAAGTAATDDARNKSSASSESVAKRRRTDCVNASAEELSQKLDAILGGRSELVTEKYKLFFVENLRGVVTIEELVKFVRLRCPNDVDLANNILKGFTAST